MGPPVVSPPAPVSDRLQFLTPVRQIDQRITEGPPTRDNPYLCTMVREVESTGVDTQVSTRRTGPHHPSYYYRGFSTGPEKIYPYRILFRWVITHELYMG